MATSSITAGLRPVVTTSSSRQRETTVKGMRAVAVATARIVARPGTVGARSNPQRPTYAITFSPNEMTCTRTDASPLVNNKVLGSEATCSVKPSSPSAAM
jgi:hypothetical protein